MDQQAMPATFDRATDDVGNIVEFGHVNVFVPDQREATLFYVTGLGLTRDPFINVGVENMWVNVGTAQFHLPTGKPQVVRGTVGLVVPDFHALPGRLDRVLPQLRDGHLASWRAVGDAIEVTCPWGNRIRCHAPDPEQFGPIVLGMPYVELDTPTGTVERIARFYREILGGAAVASATECRVRVGTGFTLIFRETAMMRPDYQGDHVQITLADFSGPHARLLARGLITEESNASQYRFQDIVDLDTGDLLVTVEHEVRSMRHPMFARPLVNRAAWMNPQNYRPGLEAQEWAMREGRAMRE